MKKEQTVCPETSAYKIHKPGNYPEESIRHSEHGESLKSEKNSACSQLKGIRIVLQWKRPKYRVIRNDSRGFNNLPPRSSDATPCDIFLWGYVNDQVYVPPLPASVPELKVRIRTAIETITADKLQTVWNELDYRVDVCRITKGSHTEHGEGM